MAKLSTVSIRRIFIGAGIALVANLVLFAIGDVAGATWSVGLPFSVNWAMVAAASVIPILIGGQIVRMVSKTRGSINIWAAWLVLAFAVAGAPSGWIASQDLPTGIALGSMHIVVGFVWFFTITQPSK